MKNKLYHSTVLITGGTGTFGNAFLDECLKQAAAEVRILSRDEKKQFDMMQRYREYKNVRFFLGDIRDKDTVDAAMKNVDYVFHAAAMKQVPSCEAFPMEAVKTNIIGSENVLNSAIGHGVRKVVCLSTDKAVYPTSAMGMTKAYMEKLALQKAAHQDLRSVFDRTSICITRFGNLIASRGSAVPLFIEQVENGLPITITDADMTRFVMTVEDAVDLVSEAFDKGQNGDLYVKTAAACSTGTLANAVCKYKDLPEAYPRIVIGKRAGEKMHESLLSEEEAEVACNRDGYMIVSKYEVPKQKMVSAYRSDQAKLIDEDELITLFDRVFNGGAVK